MPCGLLERKGRCCLLCVGELDIYGRIWYVSEASSVLRLVWRKIGPVVLRKRQCIDA